MKKKTRRIASATSSGDLNEQSAPRVQTPAAPLIAFKGFDKNLQCRGFQFEVGKTYKHDGPVKACESGFHSCENPLDVLRYYPLMNSRFCEVEVGGAVARHDEDSKIACAEITIKAEIKLPEYIKRAVDWVVTSCKGSPNSSSGYGSKAASSGDGSTAASSGYGSKAASSGNYSKAASSGDGSTAASSGNQTVAMAAGYNCTVKAGPDGVMAAAWHDGKHPRISVAYVGENGIKADTPYRLNDKGEFEEVK